MSETPSVPPKGGKLLKGKVFGVPTIYLVGGFVVILAFIAWKMKSNAPAPATTDPNSPDAANPTGSTANPVMPVGTVVAPAQPPVDTPVKYEDNSTWTREVVGWLVAHGTNPGDAQLAIQHYLAGATLSYQEGQIRDKAVTQFGLPPDGFDAGPTLPRPVPAPNPSAPVPVVPKPSPPKPVTRAPSPTPTPPMRAPKYYVVRTGDTLSGISAKFHYPGGWQALYARNRSVIGNDPNLIRPGERLIVG